MTPLALLVLVVGLAVIAWVFARAKALAFTAGAPRSVHSLPHYHAWFVVICGLLPALIFLAVWSNVAPALVTGDVLAHPAARELPETAIDRGAVLAEVRGLADGSVATAFNPTAETLVPAYRAAERRYGMIGTAVALLLLIAGAVYGYTRLKPDFRARTRVERLIMLALIAASLIAILTTFGIVASLLFESLRFFSMVSPVEFLFGTQWSPQSAVIAGQDNAFGAVPLFWGTIFIGAIIAMVVAIPLGLMSAIYLTQYAHPRTRSYMKPALEMLAGVPTVVYGYFAALTMAPLIRDFAVSIGITSASSESALAAGLVMGIMIIPFVSSMADDSIAAVPGAMKDGSLALGATKSETIRRVLVPAALPGIVGGVLLAVSRAIGETMIVVMAAGLAANLTANPFASVTTVTTQIVQLLTGDQEFDSPKTLAAFALGLVLFVVTLILNIVALQVVKKYREAYE
jgi:phosphate transport system permease protein